LGSLWSGSDRIPLIHDSEPRSSHGPDHDHSSNETWETVDWIF
jgi:hypothetical protein